MLTIAVAVLLAQAAPQADGHAAVRQWLVAQYQEVDRQLAQFEESLDGMAEPSAPLLGLRLQTVEKGGTPPVRWTVVTGTIPGSSAERSRLQEGDRIVAIGSEELDHETGKAVLLYLSGHEDRVPLTIERAGERRSVTLERTPIPCLEKATRKFRTAIWKRRFAELRRTLQGQASHLPAMATEEGLGIAFDNLQKASELGAKMLQDIGQERGLAMAQACVPVGK
jgi:hypothetical protein